MLLHSVVEKYVDAIWCSEFSRLPLLDFFLEVCHVCFFYYYCKALGNVSTIIVSNKTIFHNSVFMVHESISISLRIKYFAYYLKNKFCLCHKNHMWWCELATNISLWYHFVGEVYLWIMWDEKQQRYTW